MKKSGSSVLRISKTSQNIPQMKKGQEPLSKNIAYFLLGMLS